MSDPQDLAETGQLRHCASTTSTLNNTPQDSPTRSRSPDQDTKTRNQMTSIQNTVTTEKNTDQTQNHDRFLYHELDMRGLGAVIIACFFTSGLIDAVAFNSWNCFVGMQTGNTVFAALGIGGQPVASHREQYYKSLVAIASFCIGTLFFNALHRWPTGISTQPSSRRRLVFATSFFFQTIFIIIAAALVQAGKVSNMPYISGTFSSGSHNEQTGDNANYLDLVPVALLSFEAAGQVCLSRVLSLIELPTIVLSTLYHDFTADLYNTRVIWKSSTSIKDFICDKFKRQEKRFLSIAALFCGALVGGEMYKSDIGMAGALWCASGIKLVMTVSFMLWRHEKSVTVSDLP